MLNDTQCRKAKPKEMPYKLSDEKGLYLEIKPNGVKAWRYRFELVRVEGRKDGRKAFSPLGTTRQRLLAKPKNRQKSEDATGALP